MDSPLLAAGPHPASGLKSFGVMGASCLQGRGSRQQPPVPSPQDLSLSFTLGKAPWGGTAGISEQHILAVSHGYTRFCQAVQHSDDVTS